MDASNCPIILIPNHQNDYWSSKECDGQCSKSGSDPKKENESGLSLNRESELILVCQNIWLTEIQRSQQDRWYVVCVPGVSNGAAVLNEAAVSLLRSFLEPKSVTASLRSFPNETDLILSAVSNLLALGFLSHAGATTKILVSREETLSAWIHLTNECNLACSYCYINKSKENMDLDVGFRAIDAIFRSASHNRFSKVALKFAGGEATLQSARLIRVHDYAQQLAQAQNIRLTSMLLTNGLVIADELLTALDAHTFTIALSLDGVGNYHNIQRPLINGRSSFPFVSRTVDKLISKGLAPHIMVTLSARNIEGLPDLLEFILQRDLSFNLTFYRENQHSSSIDDLQYGDQMMINGLKKAFEVLERHLPHRSLMGALLDRAQLDNTHEHACGAGHNYLVIDQKGNVAKCQMEIEKPITTIDTYDPLQIIREDRMQLRNISVDEKEGCRDCSWRYWCAGGCPAVTFRVTGRYDIKSPNCNIYKALFPEVLRLEGLRILRDSRS